MEKSVWLYSGLDMALSSFLLMKRHRHNSHSLKKQMQKTIFFVSLRISAIYCGVEYYSKLHMAERCKPILAK